MRTLGIIALGIGIWSISLFWPQLNEWLTVEIQIGLVVGLSGLILLYEIWKKHHKAHSGRNRPLNNGQSSDLVSLPTLSNL